jgi:hypothetical protein
MHQRGGANTPTTVDSKRLRVGASPSPFRPQELSPFSPGSESSASPFAKKPPPAPSSISEDEVLAELDAKILKLEQQLEDFAISAAKRFALKKDLAMTRSQKIRHLRKLGLKP